MYACTYLCMHLPQVIATPSFLSPFSISTRALRGNKGVGLVVLWVLLLIVLLLKVHLIEVVLKVSASQPSFFHAASFAVNLHFFYITYCSYLPPPAKLKPTIVGVTCDSDTQDNDSSHDSNSKSHMTLLSEEDPPPPSPFPPPMGA